MMGRPRCSSTPCSASASGTPLPAGSARQTVRTERPGSLQAAAGRPHHLDVVRAVAKDDVCAGVHQRRPQAPQGGAGLPAPVGPPVHERQHQVSALLLPGGSKLLLQRLLVKVFGVDEVDAILLRASLRRQAGKGRQKGRLLARPIGKRWPAQCASSDVVLVAGQGALAAARHLLGGGPALVVVREGEEGQA
jgi:hypothetical protein